MRLHPWKIALLGSVLAGVAYLVVDGELVREAVWRLNLIGACVAIAVGLRLNGHGRGHRHPWWILFVALSILVTVNMLTYPAWVTPLAQRLADPLSMLAFPLIGVAALAIFRLQAPGGDRESAVDGAIVMVAMATVLVGTAFHPDSVADVSWAGMLLNSVIAPLMMAAVTAATFRLLFVGSVRIASAWFVVIASASGLFGNTMRAALTSGGTYERGIWSDLFILVSYAAIGLACLHPSSPRLTERADAPGSRFTHARLGVLGVALLAAPVTLFVRASDPYTSVTVLASVVVSILVLLRISQLVVDRERTRRQLQQRAERQEALARLGLRAIDERDLPALCDDAVREIGRLLDVRAVAIVTTGRGDEDPSVVSFAMAGDERVLQAERERPWTAEDLAFLQAVANVLGGAMVRNHDQELLREQAVYDGLTGLPNRVLILDRLEQELAACRRHGGELVVMFIDLDDFKQVNDDHGHHAGDELLIAVAQRLSSTVRESDTVGRLAGDEFVVIGSYTGRDELGRLAERVVSALAQPFPADGGRSGVAASVGVVVAGGAGADAERVLGQADAAMYQAKRRPGGAFDVYDERLGDERQRRRQLASDLEAALLAGELRLVYQPFVRTDAPGLTRVVGAEALLRWDRPDGPCPPSLFIPVAEMSDLIVRVGDQVIAEACRQLARWSRYLTPDRPFTLYVNLASRQLADPGLPGRVAEVLSSTGVDPARLGFEVAETAVIDDTAVAVAGDLKRLGVKLALDDFGTGFTSIAHLRRLPLDLIKLDGSLVAGSTSGPGGEAIVRAIVVVATELGIDVLAEQVETPQELTTMQRLGCELMQGYLFARPGPASGAEPPTVKLPSAGSTEGRRVVAAASQ